MDFLINELRATGQEQVLKFYDELTEEQKLKLESDIREIDWKKLSNIYTEQVYTQTAGGSKVTTGNKIDDNLLEELPLNCIEGYTRSNSETLNSYRTTGLTCIGQGKVAALLLAGGQGTRLGVDYPKGMYDVGPPCNKSLFQLQAERILKLSEPLEMATGQKTQIIWYIMTSEATMDMTRMFFESHDYFGLNKNDIIFFEQNTLPCFDFKGKVLLDKQYKISRSPDGNGGLFEALHQKGIIDHMTKNGVQYVHVYCVDNILVRICDPTFMGYCITKQVDAGAKVVAKVSPDESVGIICKVKNQFRVIEYSEISDEVAHRCDKDGKLVFNAGNICDHFFKVDFLRSIGDDKELRYHLAFKKIPHISLETGEPIKPTQPNGIKLEKFIFDVFEFTDRFAAWEVSREQEFSPLKNSPGSEKDNPTTALKALMRCYQSGWLSV